MPWYDDITFAAGEVVTEATMDKIPANFAMLSPAGDPAVSTAYSTTWEGASSNPAIGNGSISSTYRRVGGLVCFFVRVTAGSTTTFGSGLLSLTLPVTPAQDGLMFSGGIFDSSGGALYLLEGRNTGTTVNLYHVSASTSGLAVQTTATAPVTLASGDTIELSGVYMADVSVGSGGGGT